LKHARTSIEIVDHRVTDPEIIRLLEERQASGVNVRIFGRGDLNGMVSHGKLILVDGRHAVIGSVALSQPSLDLRREVAITIEEPELLEQLTRFLEDCARPGVKDLPGHVDDEEEYVEEGDDED
jgi:phosphatidylserine/phosphatidylglycerophosphate/cardiolipin synthase-like enzyme